MHALILLKKIQSTKWMASPVKNLEFRDIFMEFSNGVKEALALRINPAEFQIQLHLAKKGDEDTAESVLDQKQALLVINGGFFDKTHHPLGYFKLDNKVINKKIISKGSSKRLHFGSIFMVNHEGKVFFKNRDTFDPSKARHALQAGPLLVEKGSAIVNSLKPYHHYTEVMARRSLLALDKNGKMIFLSTNDDFTWCELQILLTQPKNQGGLEVAHAMNLDGGSSTQMVMKAKDLKIKTVSERLVPAFIIVTAKPIKK